MGQEDREKFDKVLADANRRVVLFTSPEETQPRSKAPSWWPGDEQVTFDNLEAARNLGYSIGGVK